MTPQDAEKLAADIEKIKRARVATSSIISASYAYDIIRQLIDIVRVQHEALLYVECNYEGANKAAIVGDALAVVAELPEVKALVDAASNYLKVTGSMPPKNNSGKAWIILKNAIATFTNNGE